jgi:uncharacterized protein (DUF2336 family)
MDINILDGNPGVAPLLARLHDSQKLYALAKNNQPGARAELTTAISVLLEMNLSDRESELVADILIVLMRQAEKDLRRALAEKLSVIDNIPLRLILELSNDEIEVAAPVLRHSNVLGEADLIGIIKSKGPAYWRQIAARKKLSDQLVNLLTDTRDFDTALALVKNSEIRLTEHALVILAELARNSHDIAAPLLRRGEIPASLAGELYQFVSYELKRFIIENHDLEAGILIEAIDDIVLELGYTAGEDPFAPSPAMIKMAQRFKEKGLLTVNTMLGTLKRGQTQSFAAMFTEYTGLSYDTMATILRQPSGQGLAVTCRAFDIGKQDFISLYLLSNRLRNGGKMVDLKDITRAISYYDRIQPAVARGIIENSLGSLY